MFWKQWIIFNNNSNIYSIPPSINPTENRNKEKNKKKQNSETTTLTVEHFIALACVWYTIIFREIFYIIYFISVCVWVENKNNNKTSSPFFIQSPRSLCSMQSAGNIDFLPGNILKFILKFYLIRVHILFYYWKSNIKLQNT